MILAEGAGWKIDVDAANRFVDRGVSGKVGHPRAEYRVGTLWLSVEEEALQAVAEASLDGAWQIAQHVGRAAASHQYDLNSVAGSFDHELEISQRAAMRSIGIGRDASFANGFSDQRAGFVDQRMMNPAMGDVDDAMAVRLEEADLGVLGRSAHGQTRAMAVAVTGDSMDAWIREAGGGRDLEKICPCVFG